MGIVMGVALSTRFRQKGGEVLSEKLSGELAFRTQIDLLKAGGASASISSVAGRGISSSTVNSASASGHGKDGHGGGGGVDLDERNKQRQHAAKLDEIHKDRSRPSQDEHPSKLSQLGMFFNISKFVRRHKQLKCKDDPLPVPEKLERHCDRCHEWYYADKLKLRSERATNAGISTSESRSTGQPQAIAAPFAPTTTSTSPSPSFGFTTSLGKIVSRGLGKATEFRTCYLSTTHARKYPDAAKKSLCVQNSSAESQESVSASGTALYEGKEALGPGRNLKTPAGPDPEDLQSIKKAAFQNADSIYSPIVDRAALVQQEHPAFCALAAIQSVESAIGLHEAEGSPHRSRRAQVDFFDTYRQIGVPKSWFVHYGIPFLDSMPDSVKIKIAEQFRYDGVPIDAVAEYLKHVLTGAEREPQTFSTQMGKFQVELKRGEDLTLDEFRDNVLKRLNEPDFYCIISYSRVAVGQDVFAGGHVAPLGGYNPKDDTVLILEVQQKRFYSIVLNRFYSVVLIMEMLGMVE